MDGFGFKITAEARQLCSCGQRVLGGSLVTVVRSIGKDELRDRAESESRSRPICALIGYRLPAELSTVILAGGNVVYLALSWCSSLSLHHMQPKLRSSERNAPAS